MANESFTPTTFTVTKGDAFDYTDRYGDQYHVEAGTEQPFTDSNKPCAAADFLAAAAAQERMPQGDTSTSTAVDAVLASCGASTGGGAGLAPPPTPAPTPDPSATGKDGNPGGDGETADTLNAPKTNPQVNGSLDQRDPGESNGQSLPSQYYDKQNPMPNYDILAILSKQGVPPDQLDEALRKIIHNEPPKGEPHYQFGRNDRRDQDTLADPVIIFTGQYSLTETDIQIPSRGFPLRLTRIYQSGPVYFGPWGYNWDHNYNVYLRELNNGGVAIWMGILREDIYTPAAGGGYESPIGVFYKLERQTGMPTTPDQYVLTDREGRKLIFFYPESWPRSDRMPLVRLEDRNGNAHLLFYDDQGRLAKVVDHANRFIQFSYGDCGLLEQVNDHTGRTWHYIHDDDIEHLIAVTTPATPEYPQGLTRRYEYDRYRDHPALIHNLISVTNPAGEVIVTNTYGDDPDTDDFGRVIYQEFGGFENYYSMTPIQYVPRTPEAINVPARRVEVIDPGILRVYTFNYRGDLLDERYRLVLDDTYRLVAYIYRYDEQGNIIEQREPNGLGLFYTYDYQHTDPRARQNLLKVELLSPPTKPAPSRIITLLTYEQRFYRLQSIQDEEGRITAWTYDYEETMGESGNVVRITYPTATLPDGTAQQRVEHFRYNESGQLTEYKTGAGYRHTFAYATSGIKEGWLKEITWDSDGVQQKKRIEYDAVGHRSAVVDGLGNRTEMVFNALDQVITQRFPAINGTIDEAHFFYTPDGFLRREEWPQGNYKDDHIIDSFISTEYAYDVLGHLTRVIYGSNTAQPRIYRYQYDGEGRIRSIIDPMGSQTLMTYDERGLLLTLHEAAGTALEAVWRYTYDRNGNRVMVVDPVGHRFDYLYDTWDRLQQITLPGAADAERTKVDFTLNHSDKAIHIRIFGLTGSGGVGTLFESFTDYDERERPWRRRVNGQSMILTYDADERVIKQTDQRNNVLTLAYDGLNRVIRAEDPVGNIETRLYDAAGNLITIESHEVLPDGHESEILTTQITYDSRLRPIKIAAPLGRIMQRSYDARNNVIREIDPLGLVVEREFGLQGELLSATAEISPGMLSTHHFSYDLVGHQVAYTDPEGHMTRYEFDERSRRTAIVYPDGRAHHFFYEGYQQVRREVTPGGTVMEYTYGPDAGLIQVDFTPGNGVAVTPSLNIERDGLRRAIRLQQGSGVLERTYDSNLRLVSESFEGKKIQLTYDDTKGTGQLTYPDGRVDRLDFDPLGRLLSITLEAVGSAKLTGNLDVGTQVVRYSYRGPERVAQRELHNGLTTQLDYDAAGRLTAILHLDSLVKRLAVVRYVYDSGDRRRLVWAGPQPQQPARFDYDGLYRVHMVALGLPVTEPTSGLSQDAANAIIANAEAATVDQAERYTLNSSDARTMTMWEKPGEVVTETYGFNSVYQLTHLDRSGPGAGSWVLIYDNDGRCIQDQHYRYLYDALGRLIEVRDAVSSSTLLEQEFDPVGRVSKRIEETSVYEQIYYGFRMMQRYSAGGGTQIQYTYGLGVDEIVVESDGSNRYLLQDAASTLLAYADATGAVLERYRYSPFGEASIWTPDGVTERKSSAIQGIPRFGGYPLLKIGLYDARARVYKSSIGRFLQPDALGYVESPNLYSYVHHDPVDLVDPTGEAGILLGLAIAAGVGLLVGGGINATRQAIQIHEGTRSSFSFGEVAYSAGIGSIAGPALVVAPELAIPLTAYGVGSGVSEISQGHWETGTFDVVTSLLPFGMKGVRSATFGRGSVFAPGRGLGPSATAAERFGRFTELGRAARDLAGRIWNERFYHGTSWYAARETIEMKGVDLARIRNTQLHQPAPPELGPGLYFTSEPGDPSLPGSAAWHAGRQSGGGRGGGPAVLEAGIPRWRLLLLRRRPGVQIDVPQSRSPVKQSFFPLEGPEGLPPNGPGADFNAAARWGLWDPEAAQPNLNGLWPAIAVPPLHWPNDAPRAPKIK